jgi:glycosyltransferase involved in cell wall biosynthesis
VIFLLNLAEALTDLYDDAELLVTLSWRETFCLPALEAMARGIPVVASAWGGAREIIGATGRLVDPRDHEAAKSAILELLAMSNRLAVGVAIRAQADRFTWATTAAQTLEIYRSLIGRSSNLSATETSAMRS